MQREIVLTSVPDEKLKQVIDDFVSEGATVTTEREKDGSWTVRAHFNEAANA